MAAADFHYATTRPENAPCANKQEKSDRGLWLRGWLRPRVGAIGRPAEACCRDVQRWCARKGSNLRPLAPETGIR